MRSSAKVKAYPTGKDGGRWIALGNVRFGDEDDRELLNHAYAGERFTVYENFAESRLLRQYVYSADGFLNLPYYYSSDYTFLK